MIVHINKGKMFENRYARELWRMRSPKRVSDRRRHMKIEAALNKSIVKGDSIYGY